MTDIESRSVMHDKPPREGESPYVFIQYGTVMVLFFEGDFRGRVILFSGIWREVVL